MEGGAESHCMVFIVTVARATVILGGQGLAKGSFRGQVRAQSSKDFTGEQGLSKPFGLFSPLFVNKARVNLCPRCKGRFAKP